MSNKINDGGPAFARDSHMDKEIGLYVQQQGMSLRDYFAAEALLVAWNAYDSGYFGDTGDESANHAVATAAYQMADAMLKAREAKP